ncbi:glycosyltransferase family 2 protein [bacterium]|nr:glycosyltransferase family 2 protein [bacterium]
MTAISIIIPAYNVEEFIKQSLDSILNQTFKDFEVLCVEDCSTDNTFEILKEYEKKDNRIKVIKHETNKGVATARNTALDIAKGEYIVCVDPDDWIENDALECIYNAFQSNINADSVWYNAINFNEIEKTKFMLINENDLNLKSDGYYKVTADNICQFNDYIWNKAYKTSIINELNIRYPDGMIFEDAEFCVKYFTQRPDFYYISKPLYNHRFRKGSIVTEGVKGYGHLEDLFNVYMNIFNFIKEKGFFHEYREALLIMLAVRVYMIKLPNQREVVVNKMQEILQKIDFPNAYMDLDNGKPEILFYK